MAVTLADEVSPRKLDLVGITGIRDLLFEMGKGRRPTPAELVADPTLTPDTLLKLSIARISKRADQPDFPKPAHETGRGRLWRRADIVRWAENWDQKPGPPVRRQDG